MLTRETQRNGQDRRQQIMQAATQLFARQGFRGTTTRQIAEKARVNEAIIFRHFRRKEDLYQAVIEQKCLVDGTGTRPDQRLRPTRNVQRVFAAIAEAMLRRQSQDGTASRLLLFSALEKHRLSHRFFRAYVADYYDSLADYIRQQIREGVFRSVDPYFAARAFLGMVVYHFLTQELFGSKGHRKLSLKQASRMLTSIWLKGTLNGNGYGPRTSSSPDIRNDGAAIFISEEMDSGRHLTARRHLK